MLVKNDESGPSKVTAPLAACVQPILVARTSALSKMRLEAFRRSEQDSARHHDATQLSEDTIEVLEMVQVAGTHDQIEALVGKWQGVRIARYTANRLTRCAEKLDEPLSVAIEHLHAGIDGDDLSIETGSQVRGGETAPRAHVERHGARQMFGEKVELALETRA